MGPSLTLDEAAGVLGLPSDAVVALRDAGFLASAGADGETRFALGDLKGFLARHADGDHVTDVLADATGGVDPQALLDALDGRADEMARRALEIFTAVFPDASGWSLSDEARF